MCGRLIRQARRAKGAGDWYFGHVHRSTLPSLDLFDFQTAGGASHEQFNSIKMETMQMMPSNPSTQIAKRDERAEGRSSTIEEGRFILLSSVTTPASGQTGDFC